MPLTNFYVKDQSGRRLQGCFIDVSTTDAASLAASLKQCFPDFTFVHETEEEMAALREQLSSVNTGTDDDSSSSEDSYSD